MVWGMSSSLIQVTVAPTGTVTSGAAKVKLAILTVTGAGAAVAGMTARTAAAKSGANIERMAGPSGKGLVDDGQRLAGSHEADGAHAQDAAQVAGRDLHRPRCGRRAGRGLREGGRAGGVEGHVALGLLDDLVDVAVQNGDRAEPREQTERLGAVVGAPAPFRIERPQRDMGEDHDGGRGRP